MERCVNINHPDFKKLMIEAGINPLVLKSKVGVWQEKNNTDEFPTLEEIGIKSNQVNYNLKAVDILKDINENPTSYQLSQNREIEEFIASEKTIRDLAARISDRIGIPVRFETDRTKEYKGKIESNVAYINLAYATLDTPIHEILGHPIIRAIKGKWVISKEYNEKRGGVYVHGLKSIGNNFKDDNTPTVLWFENEEIADKEINRQVKNRQILYQNLLKELEYGKGKEVLDRVKRDYNIKGDYTIFQMSDGMWSVVDNNNDEKHFGSYGTKEMVVSNLPRYTLEEQQEEAIVELLGLYTADRLDKVKDGKVISLLKRLLKEIKSFVRSLLSQHEVEIDKLPDNMTLGDIADLLAYSNSKLILPGNEVVYTTPDNQQFKTYAEASKHISNLAKNVKDIDLNDTSLTSSIPETFELNTDIIVESNNGNYFIDFSKVNNYGLFNNPVNFVEIFKVSKEMYDKAVENGELIENSTEKLYVYNNNIYKHNEANFMFDESFEMYPKVYTLTKEEAKDLYRKHSKDNSYINDDGEFGDGSIIYRETSIQAFIEKNKEYEQSKEIIEEWKKVNNIQYNPEEVYSRGQEFVSVLGAYSDFDVNLMLQNLLQHIEDNQKAGGEFTISAFTKPIDKKINHLEGGGGKIKIKIYPQSKDIKWAANTDVFSGSVWDAPKKVNKDKKSELLGVSYTKYPSLGNIDDIQPNLASIIDNLAHYHNELGITLTGNNFRLEYDEDIPYTTKKIIDSINSILDQKYGKLVKPEFKKQGEKIVQYGLYSKGANDILDWFDTKEEAQAKVDESNKQLIDLGESPDYSVRPITKPIGIQPTQTQETLKESIDSVSEKIGKDIYHIQLNSGLGKYVIYGSMGVRAFKENFNSEEEAQDFLDKKYPNKEYTSQAFINTKIAKLKEVAKKYPRSLIRSEVRSINSNSNLGFAELDELPFQKVSGKPSSSTSIGLAKPVFSTPENPIIIPLTESTRPLYKHYNLLNKNGEAKEFATTAQYEKAVIWFRTLNESPHYSFVLRKAENKKGKIVYRARIAQKFTNPQGGFLPGFAKPVFEKAPVDNESNFVAYFNHLNNLADYVKERQENFKRNNVAYVGTKEYNEKMTQLYKSQDELSQQINSLRAEGALQNAELVFSNFVLEINTLRKILNKKSPKEYIDFNVGERIEVLSTLFQGIDINGDFMKDEVTGEKYVPINGESLDNFIAISDSVRELRRDYLASFEDVIRDLVENNPVYQSSLQKFEPDQNIIDELSDDPEQLSKYLKNIEKKAEEYKAAVEKLYSDKKDINLIEEWLLGANSANDSIGIIAVKLEQDYRMQEEEQVTRNLEESIEELDGILYEENFSLDNFYEKDEYGVDTGNIIHIYSRDWFKEMRNYSKLFKEFKYPEEKEKSKTVSYKSLISWLGTNSHVIDFTRIKAIKDIYGDVYSEFFTESDSVMEDYEESLRRVLGKYYDTVLSEVKEKLEEYHQRRVVREADTENLFIDRNVKKDSPWEFVRNYYGKKPYNSIDYNFKGEKRGLYVAPEFITFIPKKKKKTSLGEIDSKFYNKDFEKIQDNDNAYKYWEKTVELYSKHINPTYNTRGKYIGSMNWGKYLKDSLETLQTKGDNTGFVAKVFRELADTTIKRFEDHRNITDSREQVQRNYSDNSKEAIRKFSSYLQLKKDEELMDMALDRGIVYSKVAGKKGGDIRKELIEVIARYEVLSLYSKDLTRNTLALSKEASLHRARVETANVTELIKNYNKTIKTAKGKDRSRSNEKLDSFIDTVIYNKRTSETIDKKDLANQSKMKHLSKMERKIKKILTDLKKAADNKESVAFTMDNKEYGIFQGEYYVKDLEKPVVIDEDGAVEEEGKKISTLDQASFEEALGAFIRTSMENLGSPITANSALKGAMSVVVAKAMLLNPESGVKNRIEGMFTNMIRDAEGSSWTRGNLRNARRDLTGMNVYRELKDSKFTPEGLKKRDSLETFMQLYNRFGVFEDRSNELDRRDSLSRYRRMAKKFDPYKLAIGYPEYKNQAEIVHCMLQDLKIKDLDGNIHDFYNKKTGEWVAFEPGTLTLKKEFRRLENLGWETFHLKDGAEFFVAKVKIDDTIKRVQGNYSDFDSVKALDSEIGKACMIFLRWFPEHFAQRFITREVDIVQGRTEYVGRYNIMRSNAPAISIFATSLLFAVHGPIGLTMFVGGSTLVLPFIIRLIMSKKLNASKSIAESNYNLLETLAMLQEVVVNTFSFPLEVLKIPVKVPKLIKAIDLDNLEEKGNTGLSESELRAIRGLCKEVSIILTGTLALFFANILLKSLMKIGGDDDDDKYLTYIYNYINNAGSNLIKSFTSWSDPYSMFDQNGKIAVLRAIEDASKLIKLIDDWIEKGGIEDPGRFLYQLNKVQPVLLIPNSVAKAVFKNEYPFFNKRDYEPGSWLNRYAKSGEERAKAQAEFERVNFRKSLEEKFERSLKETYEDTDVSEEIIKEEAKDMADKIVRKTYHKGKETNQETLEKLRKVKEKYKKKKE